MRESILFVCPAHDDPTAYLHYFAEKVSSELQRLKVKDIFFLSKNKAVRSNFESYIRKKNPRLIILNGHGNKDQVCGHQNDPILDKTNITLLKNRIIYAVACDSSEALGEVSINDGNADAYVGYDAKFMIVVDNSRATTPDKDKNLKIFLKPYASFILGIHSGFSVKRSMEETQTILRELIREYGAKGIRDRYGDPPLIRFALTWDLLFLRGYGNLDAVL